MAVGANEEKEWVDAIFTKAEGKPLYKTLFT